jgi:hypothetical protein
MPAKTSRNVSARPRDGVPVAIASASPSPYAVGEVTAIDQRRFHADLTPEITLSCEAHAAEGTQAQLVLELARPSGLGRLDQVTNPVSR